MVVFLIDVLSSFAVYLRGLITFSGMIVSVKAR